MTDNEVKWLIVGKLLRRNLMAGVKEATMYSYNGVVLPKLPEKSGCEYCVIFADYDPSADTVSWDAFLMSSPFYVTDSGKVLFTPGKWNWFSKTEKDVDWVSTVEDYDSEKSDEFWESCYLLWANHDILNENGMVFQKGSQPVPVYGGE